MKKNFLQIAMALGLGTFALDSSAQMFRLRVTDYGTLPSGALRTALDTELQNLENEINKELPNAKPQRLMEGMANSSVMAGKGIGSDYASNMEVFLIGAGVGVGADLEKDESTDSDISGLGVAPGLVVGANLGFVGSSIFGLDSKKLNMYFNFMSYGVEKDFEDDANKKSSAEIDMKTMGVHFRYDWIKGAGNKFLGWGGVKLHWGYEYNKTDLAFKTTISENVSTTDGTNTISGSINGSPTAEIAVATHSIPLEISSDVQLFYFLSLYGGLGADLNFGQAKGDGALNAQESNLSCTENAGGAACPSIGTIKVQPEANIDSTGKVSPLLARGFAGVQINVPYFRLFGQVDKAFGNELVGVTVGARFVY